MPLTFPSSGGGGGLPTALYDADGSVVASVDDIGNVVFTNGFSTTGDIYGDLDFAGGLLTGNCDIDITGGITTSGRADIGGDLEVHGDAYFDGVAYFFNGINTDGVAIEGGNYHLSGDGSASFAQNAINTTFEIDANGNLLLNSVNVAGSSALINSDGSASFAGGNIQLNSDGSASFNENIESASLTQQDGRWAINIDGSASFAGGNIQFDHDGTAELANGLSTFFIDGTVRLNGIPTGDPHDAGQVYQDATTHALFVSQG